MVAVGSTSVDEAVVPLSLPTSRRRRRRVPSVIQMEQAECGAACLAMVLGSFGQFVTLAEMREECQVSRDGTSALQLAKVARARGLDARGFRHELDALENLSTPAILYWSFNHFVVLEGWDRQGAWINDPARGPRRASWEEMDRCFTGVGLEFQLTDAFRRSGRPASTLRRAPRLLSGYGRSLVLAAILGVLSALPGIAAAGFLSFFINAILVPGDLKSAVPFVIALLVTLVMQVGFGWLTMSTVLGTTSSFATSLAARVTWRMLRLPMRYFTQRAPGEVVWRMNLPSDIGKALAGPLPVAVVSLVSLALYGAAMIVISPWAAAVGIGVACANAFVMRSITRVQRDGLGVFYQYLGKLSGEVSSGLGRIEYVKATGAEDELFSQFTGTQAFVVNARQRLRGLTQYLTTVPGLLSILGSAAVMGIAGIQVINGTLAVGGLVALQVLLAGFLAPFANLVQLGGTLSEVGASLAKVDDVMEGAPSIDGVRLAQSMSLPESQERLVGRIEFRDVVFGYSAAAEPLLRGLSFQVEPGHRIAFVGTSGAGKSTVSRLLTGLEIPWSGEILLDGVPRDQWPSAVVTASLALVDQGIVLFPGSIQDNLTLWDPRIPADRVVAAARDAAIDDMISARPGGYGAMVAENARNISGGQAQRIEIARALAQDPTILVLDEATSALDAATEMLIDEAIRRRGCTTVVIAHRMSTIRDADLILVLDRGVVVQSGTHEELIDVDGLYRTLVTN